MSAEQLFRVRFMSQDKLYEVYAREVYQGALYGFVVLEELVFNEHTTVVVDPAEERLKAEFEGVTEVMVPLHAVIRIDMVEKRGTAKITDLGSNVHHFPSPVYPPRDEGPKGQ
jgi:hypothetical protein